VPFTRPAGSRPARCPVRLRWDIPARCGTQPTAPVAPGATAAAAPPPRPHLPLERAALTLEIDQAVRALRATDQMERMGRRELPEVWNTRRRRPGLVARLCPRLHPLDSDFLIVGLVIVVFSLYAPVRAWLGLENLLHQFLDPAVRSFAGP
jgi:hypothetical protein